MGKDRQARQLAIVPLCGLKFIFLRRCWHGDPGARSTENGPIVRSSDTANKTTELPHRRTGDRAAELLRLLSEPIRLRVLLACVSRSRLRSVRS